MSRAAVIAVKEGCDPCQGKGYAAEVPSVVETDACGCRPSCD
ncbi:hypothetical protein ABTZ21_12595 [Streptomyces sp. NPDC096191]